MSGCTADGISVPHPAGACLPSLPGERVIVMISIIVFIIVLLQGGLELTTALGVALTAGLVAADVAFHLLGPPCRYGHVTVDDTRQRQR